MNVAVLGRGGREHAICNALKNSLKIDKLFCIPGNAGTEKIAINIDSEILNFEKLYQVIKKNNIELIVVGPEQPLVEGIVDYFSDKNIKIFGPDKFTASLEGSKYFTKKICQENNIPTAKFGIFENLQDATDFIKKNNTPIVVKADGLASGKGVSICKTKKEAIKAVKEILSGKFKSSSKVLLEEFLIGEEMSYFIVTDEKNYKFFGSAQDHKRVGEKDTGPNTGGMGAYSPSAIINDELEKKILTKIIEPTLNALKKKNHPFKGFLYAGLMIVDKEPFLIEYNVRMGDPECQSILPRLNTDFLEVIQASINNNISNLEIKWKKEKSMCIALCSKGYPGEFNKDLEIKNISAVEMDLNNNEFIFHAGTYKKKEKIYSNGGRVLNIVALSEKLSTARNNNIKIINKINWKNGFYRKDIGWKAIKK